MRKAKGPPPLESPPEQETAFWGHFSSGGFRWSPGACLHLGGSRVWRPLCSCFSRAPKAGMDRSLLRRQPWPLSGCFPRFPLACPQQGGVPPATLLHSWGRWGLLPRRGRQDGSHWHAGWSWGSSPERGLGGPSPAASFQLSGPLAPHPSPNAGLPGGPWGDAGFFLLPTPPSTCGCADLGEAVIQAQSGCWGRPPSILRSGCWGRPPILRSRHADLQTHAPLRRHRVPPGSAHTQRQHRGHLCHSLPAARALPPVSSAMGFTCDLFISMVNTQKESQPHNTSNPLRDPCLENPMHRRARQATVHGVAKGQTRVK